MQISDKARFCRYCGEKVDEDIEPVRVSDEPVPVYPVNEPVESAAIHIEPVNVEPAEPEQIHIEPVMPEQIHITPADPEPENVSPVTDDTIVLDPFYEMSDSAPDEPTVIEPVQEDITVSEPVPAEPEPLQPEPVQEEPAGTETIEDLPIIEVPAEPETVEDLPLIKVTAEPETSADLPPIEDTLVLDPYFGDLVKPKHDSTVAAEPRPVYSDTVNPESAEAETIIPEPAEESVIPEPAEEGSAIAEPVQEEPEPVSFAPVTDNAEVPDPYSDLYEPVDTEAAVKEPAIHEPVIPDPRIKDTLIMDPFLRNAAVQTPAGTEYVEPRPVYTDPAAPVPAPEPVNTGAVTYGLIDDYPVRRNTARMDPVVPDPGMGGGPSGPYYPYSDYGYDDEEDDDDGGGMSKRMIAFIAALAGIVATCLIIGIIMWACNGDSESEPAPEPEPAPAEQQETPEPEPEPAPAPAAYPEGALEFNGHHYVIYNESASWSSAVELCKGKNGHLVTITSAEEQAFIRQKLEEDGLMRHHYWLGATDAENEGSWRWITGEPFSYNNWDPGDGADHDRQPNNTLDQDYMELQTTRATANNYMTWNDMCDSGDNGANQNEPWYYMQQYFGYICEWDE